MHDREYHRHDTVANALSESVRHRLDRTIVPSVAVVTDDPATLRLVSRLVPFGWNVIGLGSADDALARIVEEEPLAVIAEHRMPGSDGIAVLRELRVARPATRRILVSSGLDSRELARAINEAGVDRYLAKPLEQAMVRDALEGALAQRRRELAVAYLIDEIQAENREFTSARKALEEGEAHLLHSERLAVLGRLADGLAEGIKPLIHEMREVIDRLDRVAGSYGTDLELRSIGHDAVDTIWNILGDIRCFTRDAAWVIDRQPIDLVALVHRAVRFASLDGRLRERKLIIDTPDSLTAQVDARRLRQVMLNLLRNAADATNAGDPITVRVTAEGEDAVIVVRDEGTGMPPDVAAHIFDEFFSTKGEAGLGLGLALCRTIVERHGGSIACTTKVGLGTCLTIRLPRTA